MVLGARFSNVAIERALRLSTFIVWAPTESGPPAPTEH